MRAEIVYNAGPMFDPTETGCAKCDHTKKHGVLRAVEEVLERAGLRAIPAEAGLEGSSLTVQDGRILRRTHYSDEIHKEAMKRDGDDSADFPLFKFHDGEKTRTIEVFPYLHRECGLDPWDAIEDQTWYVKRLIVVEAFTFYAHSQYSPENARWFVDNIGPELEHGVFQKQGWIDAFLEIKE